MVFRIVCVRLVLLYVLGVPPPSLKSSFGGVGVLRATLTLRCRRKACGTARQTTPGTLRPP